MQETAKLTRKEQAEITRQKLVDAALDLFVKRGYDRVTVDDICKRAGVSKGAFYGHFKTKDQAVLEEFLKADSYYQEVIAQVMKEDGYVNRMLAFSRLVLRFIESQGKMVIKVAYSSTIAPERKTSPIASQDRALYQIVDAMVKGAQENGECRTDIPSFEIAQAVIRSIRGVVYDWCLQDGGFDLEGAGATLATVFVNGLAPR
jgi:AcrR family transcriptional regulator